MSSGEESSYHTEFQYPVSISELGIPAKCGICHRPVTWEQVESGQAIESVIPSIKKFEGGMEEFASGEGFKPGRDTYIYKHTRCVAGLKKRQDRAFLKELRRMRSAGAISGKDYQEMLESSGLDKRLLEDLMDK